jgi:hypothetical protein
MDIPGYVTNHRVFFNEKIEKDTGTYWRSSDIPFNRLTVCIPGEDGFIFRRPYLLLNDKKIYGEKPDLDGLYEAIRSVKRNEYPDSPGFFILKTFSPSGPYRLIK